MNLLTLLLMPAPHTASATAPAGKGKDEDNAEEKEGTNALSSVNLQVVIPTVGWQPQSRRLWGWLMQEKLSPSCA